MGKNVVIKRGSVLSAYSEISECAELYRNVIIGKGVKVGSYSSINNSTVVECGSIGNFCSIGKDVIIGLGVHPLNYVTTSTLVYKLFKVSSKKMEFIPPCPPNIEDDVWIGNRALIMRGVTIHTGAIIGAGAVVTKDVPAYAIVVGVPAKVIRYRFDEDIRKKIQKTDLWHSYKENEERIISLLEAGDDFIDIL